MKYIKTYEGLEKEYFKMGDYVKVISVIYEVKEKVYVIDTFFDKKAIWKNNPNYYQYYLIDIDPHHSYDNTTTEFWKEQKDIRLASEEEIENYKIKITAKNYNL